MQHSGWDLTRAEQREKIPSLRLLAVPGKNLRGRKNPGPSPGPPHALATTREVTHLFPRHFQQLQSPSLHPSQQHNKEPTGPSKGRGSHSLIPLLSHRSSAPAVRLMGNTWDEQGGKPGKAFTKGRIPKSQELKVFWEPPTVPGLSIQT